MSSFNGWNIVTLPNPWLFTTMEWKVGRKTAANVSPFSGQVLTVFEWVGADSWSVTCTLPPMDSDEARAWRAFFWQAVGGVNAFMLGDPLRRKPKGVYFNSRKRSTVNTPIYVHGSNAAMATTLNVRGFRAKQPNALHAGDLLSVNFRLYEVLSDVTADASGNAAVAIRPSLREALTDGMQISTTDAQGLFRIPKQEIQINVDQNHMTTISFEAMEAR